eukprot:scaffold8509_cov119-Isochrysis_galbana.AAC.2
MAHGPDRLSTLAATSRDCAATKTAMPLHRRDREDGLGPKAMYKMQPTEPSHRPTKAKAQSSPPIMMPFAG